MEEARRLLGPGATIVGVIGSPVAHSLSPVLHNAAFAALGLGASWQSFAFEVASGAAPSALEEVRRCEVTGLSVTMPHKAAVAASVDELSEQARRLDAVNCVINTGGPLRGVNTDGEGFVASLAGRWLRSRRPNLSRGGCRRRRTRSCWRWSNTAPRASPC